MTRAVTTLLCLLLALPVAQAPAAGTDWDARRTRLVSELRTELRAYLRGEVDGVHVERALDAIAAVPRHELVPAQVRERAYANRPLPIGHGQTISQPFIVGFMTALLEPEPDDRVLEVGTGSGYQAAVLAEIVESVHTIEIIPALGERAAEDLERLGYDDVRTRVGDGYYGWESEAPFDGIVVTAAASHVPPPLVRQLAPGARMVIPVGGSFSVQHLMLVTKDAEGEVRTRQLLPVRFVPLTGSHPQGGG